MAVTLFIYLEKNGLEIFTFLIICQIIIIIIISTMLKFLSLLSGEI